MPQIVFTSHLRRIVPESALSAPGATVAAALESVFAANPRLRGYILDDQGRVRRHVAVFVDGEPLRDRDRLTDTVGPDGEIHVLQALSGGHATKGGTP